MVGSSTVQLHGSRGRHCLQIAEVAVPSHSAHVRKAEALDRRQLIRVAGGIIAFVRVAWAFSAPRDRVRTKLHHPERSRGARECLALTQ